MENQVAEKTIWDLSLHETMTIKKSVTENGTTFNTTEWRITRVPGGWIYWQYGPTSVFVSYRDAE